MITGFIKAKMCLVPLKQTRWLLALEILINGTRIKGVPIRKKHRKV